MQEMLQCEYIYVVMLNDPQGVQKC